MSSFADLHPDQRAVLQLLLGRGLGYGAIARVLRTSADRVRDRALDAVDGLVPEDVDGLGLEERERITDWLLGQQSADEAERTRAAVADSPPARAWTDDVRAALAPIAAGPLPAVDPGEPDPADREAPREPDRDADDHGVPAHPGPDPSGGGTATSTAVVGDPDPDPHHGDGDGDGDVGDGHRSAGEPARTGSTSTRAGGSRAAAGTADPDDGADDAPRGSRAGAIGLIAALVAVFALVVLLATGVIGGGGGEQASGGGTGSGSGAPPPTTQAQEPGTAQQINFDPVGESGARGVGFAQVVDGTPVLLFQGEGFPRTRPNRFYAAWLEGGAAPRRLGFLDSVGENGRVDRLVIQLPGDVGRWQRVSITQESTQNPRSPGPAVVRADLSAVTDEP